MKIMEPVLTDKVVIKRHGGNKRNAVYDKILARVEKMSVSKTLPIQCESRNELLNLFAAKRY